MSQTLVQIPLVDQMKFQSCIRQRIVLMLERWEAVPAGRNHSCSWETTSLLDCRGKEKANNKYFSILRWLNLVCGLNRFFWRK